MELSYLLEKYIEKTGYGMDMWSKEENAVMTTIAEILEEFKAKKFSISDDDRDLLPSDCYIRNKIGCHCINECEYEKDLK
jgi:hypothetical protein